MNSELKLLLTVIGIQVVLFLIGCVCCALVRNRTNKNAPTHSKVTPTGDDQVFQNSLGTDNATAREVELKLPKKIQDTLQSELD